MSISTVGQGPATMSGGAGDTGFGVGFGTPVLTMDGEIPVEFLCAGDRIITRAGAQVLRAVAVTLVRDATMVLISHDILGKDRPHCDLVLHPGQPVLIRDWRAQALYGAARAMVPAARLVDGEYIRFEEMAEVRLFTLQLQDGAVIYAGGLELACQPARETV